MRNLTRIAAALALACAAWALPARAESDLGIRVGFTDGANDVYFGAELETGAHLGPAEFTPSADIELGNDTVVSVNGDLRWDMLPIPETGIMLYLKAGPTLAFGDDNELGLSVAFGGDIPMRSVRNLHIEVRLGFGDVTETKIGATIMFAL